MTTRRFFHSNFAFIALYLMLAMPISVYSMSRTPFQIFRDLWTTQITDSIEPNLFTDVPNDALKQLYPLLKKELKIKHDVDFDSINNVGGVLTCLLKEKYGKKSNVKNDFYSIQYSSRSEDFDAYVQKYPESKFISEAKTRLEFLKECELLQTAQTKKNRNAWETFVNYCNSHPLYEYEGCNAISIQHRAIATSISEWYALTDRSSGDPAIYQDYDNYLKKYGKDAVFSNEANDSLNHNKELYDWNLAKANNSIVSYTQYLEEHESGRHVWNAKKLLEELELWEKTKASNSYEDYCNYYAQYPEGQFSEEAVKFIKAHETVAWEKAKKANNLKAYEDFVEQYPSGFYASEAQNNISTLRLAPYLKKDPSFNSISSVGYYSQPGYSLVCLGNVDTYKTITISLNGPTGFSKGFAPGTWQWIRVKNGKYKILVQASSVENWWGTAQFENKLYADAWYTSTTINGIKLPFGNTDTDATNKMLKDIKEKAADEEEKTLKYLLDLE